MIGVSVQHFAMTAELLAQEPRAQEGNVTLGGASRKSGHFEVVFMYVMFIFVVFKNCLVVAMVYVVGGRVRIDSSRLIRL